MENKNINLWVDDTILTDHKLKLKKNENLDIKIFSETKIKGNR